MCEAGTETQQMFSALPVLLIEIHFNFCYGCGSVSEKRDLRAWESFSVTVLFASFIHPQTDWAKLFHFGVPETKHDTLL